MFKNKFLLLFMCYRGVRERASREKKENYNSSYNFTILFSPQKLIQMPLFIIIFVVGNVYSPDFMWSSVNLIYRCKNKNKKK